MALVKEYEMKKLSLMSWSDSNMARDEWTWFITLTVRKNGTYSIGAMQTAVDGPTFRLPSIYPLRTGRQVRDAIEQLFLNDPLAGEEIDWQGIIEGLTEHVPELSHEIEQSFIEDSIAEAASERQYEEQEKLDAPINDWVDQARWPLSPMSHSFGNQVDNAKRRKWVFDYVRNYYTKHGRLPASNHTLHQDFRVQFPED
jgi:hypothetical protein